MTVFGSDLINRFDLVINPVAPGFIESEKIKFLDKAQRIVVNKLLSANATTLVSTLFEETVFTLINNNINNYSNYTTILYKIALPANLLKLVYANTEIYLLSPNTFIFSSCDISDLTYFNNFINTVTNRPYLEKPILFISDKDINSGPGDKDCILLIGTDYPFNQVTPYNIDVVRLNIGYIKEPTPIALGLAIELPEYADDIVDIAVKMALDSLYGIQNVAQSNQQQRND